MICSCPEYQLNMPLIDMAFVKTGGYKGKWFVHCPWCGSALQENAPLQPGQMLANLNRKHFGDKAGFNPIDHEQSK